MYSGNFGSHTLCKIAHIEVHDKTSTVILDQNYTSAGSGVGDQCQLY